MSRSFRLRSYPKLVVSWWGEHPVRNFVDSYLYKRRGFYEKDRFVEEPKLSVAPITCHKWVGFGLANVKSSTKKYYRKTGFRRARRRTREGLKDSRSWDLDFEGFFPSPKETVDPWDVI